MSERFSPEVEAVLRAAGWYPGRRLPPEHVDTMRRAVHQQSGRFGGRLSAGASVDSVLAEFGGLAIGGRRDGVDLRPRPLVLDPARAVRVYCVETLIDAGRAMGVDLYPLGVEGDGEAVVAMTDLAKVVAVDAVGEWLLGDTIDQALELLVSGRRPRPVVSGDGRLPPWPTHPHGEGELPYISFKHPTGAAFFLRRTPANLPYVWMPSILARLGLPVEASSVNPQRLRIDDWAGVLCEVHALDLEWLTVLVIAFDRKDFLRQRAERPGSDDPPPSPAATPLARAFREACAALTPDLEVALLQTFQHDDLLRWFADQAYHVLTIDGDELLNGGFSLTYLTDRMDYNIAPALAASPRDELPISGGRLIFAGTGQQRW